MIAHESGRMDTPLLALVILTITISALIRSAIGFGGALIAMGVLVPLVGLQIATPIVGMVGMMISAGVLARSWKLLDLRPIRTLIVSTLFGIPLGLVLIQTHTKSESVLGL